jgi:hypothetical protein
MRNYCLLGFFLNWSNGHGVFIKKIKLSRRSIYLEAMFIVLAALTVVTMNFKPIALANLQRKNNQIGSGNSHIFKYVYILVNEIPARLKLLF